MTFLQSNGYRLYRQDEYCDRVMASLDEIIPLDDTTDRELVATTLAAAHDRAPSWSRASTNIRSKRRPTPPSGSGWLHAP
ncbi:MAG: hypothetical protein M9905_02775 [Rhizobiaceae bacterium]|nr:hypothetical protein [Rhizobiaceae bacterium]